MSCCHSSTRVGQPSQLAPREHTRACRSRRRTPRSSPPTPAAARRRSARRPSAERRRAPRSACDSSVTAPGVGKQEVRDDRHQRRLAQVAVNRRGDVAVGSTGVERRRGSDTGRGSRSRASGRSAAARRPAAGNCSSNVIRPNRSWKNTADSPTAATERAMAARNRHAAACRIASTARRRPPPRRRRCCPARTRG